MSSRLLVAFAAACGCCLAVTGCDDGVEVSDQRSDVVASPGGADPLPPGVGSPKTDAAVSANEALTAGERVGDVGEITPDSVYEVLARTVESALTPGLAGEGALVEHFSPPDRERLGASGVGNTAEFDAAVKTFAQRWEGDQFEIEAPRALFAPITRIERRGNVGEIVRVRVIFPASGASEEFALDMVKRFEWRIDIPDEFDRARLRAAVTGHLEALQKDQNWPPDPLQARQRVAREVLSALASSSASPATRPAEDPRS